ncbi:flagellar biosynthesis protein FlgA [Aeromonas schubertii]|nr:flagellar biosynthesis protein FlgA [Aeromonas schubertii]
MGALTVPDDPTPPKEEVPFPMRKSPLALLLLLAPMAQASLEQQLLEDARTRLEHYGQSQQWPTPEASYQVWVAPGADGLPPCKQPLVLEGGGQYREPFGRRPYLIRCSDPAWSLRGRVEVRVTLPVWRAARDIERGQRIGAEDLVSQPVEVSRLYRGFIPANRPLQGAQSSRNLRAGQLIGELDLKVRHAVERGQEVIIRAASEGFSASMRGEALQDGVVGEAVRVRNLSSGKEVQAWVIGRGEVETRF